MKSTLCQSSPVRAVSRTCICFWLIALAMAGGAAHASATTVTIGQLGPAVTPAAGCIRCTVLQVETAPSSPSYTVPPGVWTLTSWSGAGGSEGGGVSLQVFRPTGTAQQFKLVAQSAEEQVDAGTVGTFPVEIAVQPGDVLGLESGSAAHPSYPEYFASPASADRVGFVTGAPTVGQTVGPGGADNYGALGEKLLDLSATLTGPTRALQVTKTGLGSGTVTSEPAGIDCGLLCAANFDLGTTVNLVAAPAAGSIFTGWSGGRCSGTEGCRVSLGEDTSVSASFSGLAAPLPVPPVPVSAPATGSHCSVPNLKGRKLKASRKQSLAADCKIGTVIKRNGAGGKTGKIVKQVPKPGTVVAPGTKIRVVLDK